MPSGGGLRVLPGPVFVAGSPPFGRRRQVAVSALYNERMAAILEPRPEVLQPVLPLVEELAPGLDAWEIARRLADRPRLLFLDSATPATAFGRHSYVTADPFHWLCSRGKDDPFPRLASLLAHYRTAPLPDLPPFQGGAGGLFGYDLCHHIERLPRPRFDEFEGPDLAVGFYDWVIACDHQSKRSWLISTGLPETEPRRRRERAERRLRQVKRWLSNDNHRVASHHPVTPSPRHPVTPSVAYPVPGLPGLTSNFDRNTYLDTVRRAIEYTHAGDCFQVNIAQRLLHPATTPPLELYRQLRECNPAPFAGYFDLGDFVIASASPERFL